MPMREISALFEMHGFASTRTSPAPAHDAYYSIVLAHARTNANNRQPIHSRKNGVHKPISCHQGSVAEQHN